MIRAWTLALGLLLASPAVTLAQDESAGESRAASFEAAQGAQTEDVPGGALLIGAYGVIWLLIFGFVGTLGVRQARVARDLERLRQDLKQARVES